MNINEEWLDKYQKNLKEMNQLFKNEDKNISKVVDFDVSKEIVTSKILGDIWYQNKIVVDVKELLANGKTEIIELYERVFDILALDKNRFVCFNPFSNCLTFYNQNFNLIRKVDLINGESFNPYGLDCSDNHLYIADMDNHRILMTDFKFNRIKSVGSRGYANNQFFLPFSLFFKNEILYICDHSNQRIQVYNKDLEFIKSAKVDYYPWVIKASNSVLFVQSGYLTKALFIYELNSFNLKQKIDNSTVCCLLSVINSNIYRFNSQTKKVLVYNENGDFKEEIVINNVDGKLISDDWDGTFIEFNGSLLMTCHRYKKFIKFSRK